MEKTKWRRNPNIRGNSYRGYSKGRGNAQPYRGRSLDIPNVQQNEKQAKIDYVIDCTEEKNENIITSKEVHRLIWKVDKYSEPGPIHIIRWIQNKEIIVLKRTNKLYKLYFINLEKNVLKSQNITDKLISNYINRENLYENEIKSQDGYIERSSVKYFYKMLGDSQSDFAYIQEKYYGDGKFMIGYILIPEIIRDYFGSKLLNIRNYYGEKIEYFKKLPPSEILNAKIKEKEKLIAESGKVICNHIVKNYINDRLDSIKTYFFTSFYNPKEDSKIQEFSYKGFIILPKQSIGSIIPSFVREYIGGYGDEKSTRKIYLTDETMVYFRNKIINKFYKTQLPNHIDKYDKLETRDEYINRIIRERKELIKKRKLPDELMPGIVVKQKITESEYDKRMEELMEKYALDENITKQKEVIELLNSEIVKDDYIPEQSSTVLNELTEDEIQKKVEGRKFASEKEKNDMKIFIEQEIERFRLKLPEIKKQIIYEIEKYFDLNPTLLMSYKGRNEPFIHFLPKSVKESYDETGTFKMKEYIKGTKKIYNYYYPEEPREHSYEEEDFYIKYFNPEYHVEMTLDVNSPEKNDQFFHPGELKDPNDPDDLKIGNWLTKTIYIWCIDGVAEQIRHRRIYLTRCPRVIKFIHKIRRSCKDLAQFFEYTEINEDIFKNVERMYNPIFSLKIEGEEILLPKGIIYDTNSIYEYMNLSYFKNKNCKILKRKRSHYFLNEKNNFIRQEIVYRELPRYENYKKNVMVEKNIRTSRYFLNKSKTIGLAKCHQNEEQFFCNINYDENLIQTIHHVVDIAELLDNPDIKYIFIPYCYHNLSDEDDYIYCIFVIDKTRGIFYRLFSQKSINDSMLDHKFPQFKKYKNIIVDIFFDFDSEQDSILMILWIIDFALSNEDIDLRLVSRYFGQRVMENMKHNTKEMGKTQEPAIIYLYNYFYEKTNKFKEM